MQHIKVLTRPKHKGPVKATQWTIGNKVTYFFGKLAGTKTPSE